VKRVLLVDDDERLREATAMLLADEGFSVTTARDGAEAMALLARQPVDVILCDLFMPGQDGLETIPHMRGQFAHVPVIAMSGGAYHGQVDVLRVAKLMGAAEALAKPFKLTDLLRAIERVLGTA
jgi:CheY-like chemotaxis protein